MATAGRRRRAATPPRARPAARGCPGAAPGTCARRSRARSSALSGIPSSARGLAHLACERVRLEARRQRASRDRERDVAHLAARLDEPRHRPAAAELAVVRVRREHERALPDPRSPRDSITTSRNASRAVEHSDARPGRRAPRSARRRARDPRAARRFVLLAGFALLGLATAGCSGARSPATTTSSASSPNRPGSRSWPSAPRSSRLCSRASCSCASPRSCPVALLAAAPFRIPVELGRRGGVPPAPALRGARGRRARVRVSRLLRGARPAAPAASSRSRSPRSWPSRRSRSSGRATSGREGSRSRSSSSRSRPASRVVARAPLAAWLPRALACTVVALGALFAAVGLWQAQTRTLFFARDLEVANAYTSFFRVTSLFKDPSLYGRYLVVPIAVLLVVLLVRRGTGCSTGSRRRGRRVPLRRPLLLVLAVELRRALRRDVRRRARRRRPARFGSCSLACAAGRHARGRRLRRRGGRGTSRRRRSRAADRGSSTITLDAFAADPVAGVGVGGQPRASAEEAGTSARRGATRRTRRRSRCSPSSASSASALLRVAARRGRLGAPGS